MAEFQLNPRVDIADLAAAFERDGIAQALDIFTPETANLIAAELENATPWRLVISAEGGRPGVLTQAQINAYGRENLRRAVQDNLQLASEGFAYTYLAYQMDAVREPAGGVSNLLHELADWLTSEPFRTLGAQVIGLPAVDAVDSKATLYRPGDFLTLHDDTGAERRAAYTLGFSRRWRPDWGGQLLLHDDARDVQRVLAPRFNALTLFRTPRWHSVAQVATYAAAPRLSVVGWLKTLAG